MNMLDEYLKFEKNNITAFAKEILSNDYFEEEAFSKLLNTYIENRYFNYYEDEEIPFEDRIFAHLRKTVIKLSEGTNEETKIKLAEMFTVFNYVLCIDGVKTLKDNTLVKLLCDYHKILYNGEDIKLFKEKISKFLKNMADKRKNFFDYFNSDEFGIRKFTTSKDNVIDIELTYNIKFPKLYSEYAIDRVFTSGTIAEDRLLVEYYLMTNIIINDMRACIFDRFYLVDFEPTLFDDKQRLEKLLSVANNDCFKNQVILKVKYDEFAKYGNNIKDMIKDGYSFAIKVDKEIDKSEYILFDIFKYIIVEKDIDKLKGKEIVINNR